VRADGADGGEALRWEAQAAAEAAVAEAERAVAQGISVSMTYCQCRYPYEYIGILPVFMLVWGQICQVKVSEGEEGSGSRHPSW
jgi:hypothetical protein